MIREALTPHDQNINDLRSSSRPKEQQRNTSREDDEESTTITYRENDAELSTEELQQEELRIFGLQNDEKEEESKDEMTDAALMTLNEDEFGLSTHNKFHQKFDTLEKDTWIGDT